MEFNPMRTANKNGTLLLTVINLPGYCTFYALSFFDVYSNHWYVNGKKVDYEPSAWIEELHIPKNLKQKLSEVA